MDKKYKVSYLPLFYEDLNKVIDYILYKLKNKIAAKKLLDELEQEINKRSNNPDYYEKYNSLRNRSNTYYRIYIKNYVVFYTLRNNTMEITRILYSRRNFKKLI